MRPGGGRQVDLRGAVARWIVEERSPGGSSRGGRQVDRRGAAARWIVEGRSPGIPMTVAGGAGAEGITWPPDRNPYGKRGVLKKQSCLAFSN